MLRLLMFFCWIGRWQVGKSTMFYVEGFYIFSIIDSKLFTFDCQIHYNSPYFFQPVMHSVIYYMHTRIANLDIVPSTRIFLLVLLWKEKCICTLGYFLVRYRTILVSICFATSLNSYRLVFVTPQHVSTGLCCPWIDLPSWDMPFPFSASTQCSCSFEFPSCYTSSLLLCWAHKHSLLLAARTGLGVVCRAQYFLLNGSPSIASTNLTSHYSVFGVLNGVFNRTTSFLFWLLFSHVRTCLWY